MQKLHSTSGQTERMRSIYLKLEQVTNENMVGHGPNIYNDPKP
jgi:hypothetical protein